MKLLLVDGYNLIHAVGKLQKLAEESLEASRDELVRMLVEYAGRQDVRVELVFDAGGRPGPETRKRASDLVTVIFTAQGKTADSRLEKASYEAASGEDTTLVTGDYHQQKVAGGVGVLRVSSREFAEELTLKPDSDSGTAPVKRSRLEDRLPDDVRERLREMREKGI